MAYKFGARRASDISSGTFADARIAASNVTQHSEALEGVLRLHELQVSAALPMGANKITGVADPSAAQDAATKAYVDSAIATSAADIPTDFEDSVLEQTATVPGSPSSGARYLVDANVSGGPGAWQNKANNVAVYDGSSWSFTAPSEGMLVFIEGGSNNANCLMAYSGSAWVKMLDITGAQPLDATLTALAGLSGEADKGVYFTGSDAVAVFDLSAFGRSLSGAANAAAVRGLLDLDTDDSPQFAGLEIGHASDTTLARASAGDLSIEGNVIYRAGGTDVPVSDGGTGASSFTNGGVLLGSGTDAITAMAVLGDGEMIVGDGSGDPVAESGATLRASIGVSIGSQVQAYDADLAAIAGLTSAADKGIQFTGSGTAGLFDLTAAGKALLDDADAAAQRATLGLVIGTNVQTQSGRLDAIRNASAGAVVGGLSKLALNSSGNVVLEHDRTQGAINPDASGSAQSITATSGMVFINFVSSYLGGGASTSFTGTLPEITSLSNGYSLFIKANELCSSSVVATIQGATPSGGSLQKIDNVNSIALDDANASVRLTAHWYGSVGVWRIG